jgi:alkylated DNA nucleotide flippase Atl1
MMSEKERFVVGSNEIGEIIVTDVETGNVCRYGDIARFFGLIRLLNEQDRKIKQLEKSKTKVMKNAKQNR